NATEAPGDFAKEAGVRLVAADLLGREPVREAKAELLLDLRLVRAIAVGGCNARRNGEQPREPLPRIRIERPAPGGGAECDSLDRIDTEHVDETGGVDVGVARKRTLLGAPLVIDDRLEVGIAELEVLPGKRLAKSAPPIDDGAEDVEAE